MSSSALTAFSQDMTRTHTNDQETTFSSLPSSNETYDASTRIPKESQAMDLLFAASGMNDDSRENGQAQDLTRNGTDGPELAHSGGDEALALLALTSKTVSHKFDPLGLTRSASPSPPRDHDDTPFSRISRRPRSVSNPEGMEKWDSYSQRTRRHFVLPESILEEELAEVSAAIREQEPKPDIDLTKSDHHYERHSYEEDEDSEEAPEDYDQDDASEVNDDDLTPDELLKRARAKLLEDMSGNNAYNSKGGLLILPHSLTKYKNVYNKNGRIGIYTPKERAAIISRYHAKRSRRNWNKKIRYGCRKSLADRRLRIKGRFVKRSEQEKLLKQLELKKNGESDENDKESNDDEMPDVNDPEAGFCPTDDLPYRRLRRHTIT